MDPFIRMATSVINLYPRNVEGWKPNGSSDFGYAIKDINGDGSVELILLRSDGTIVAVFTMHDQKPVLLDAFQNRYRCSLSDSGEIFTSGSNGAARTVNRKYSLDPATGQLLLICEFGTDGFDPDTGETSFYMEVNAARTNLTEAEYEQWKRDIRQWLVISQEILRGEMNAMNCSLGELEVIVPYCKMVRQKTIDTKRFLYYHAVFSTLTPYTNIEIHWCCK